MDTLYDVIAYFENANFPMTWLLDKPSFDTLVEMFESDVPGSLTVTNHWNHLTAVINTEKIFCLEWQELEEEDI